MHGRSYDARIGPACARIAPPFTRIAAGGPCLHGRGAPLWLRRLLSIVLVAIAAALTPAESSAQLTRADSAAVLLQAANAFAEEGRWMIAEAIYERIAERYGGTPAAEEARARLAAPDSQRPQRPSRVELQVFGTTYGAWLGIAVPLAFGSEAPEAYGAGLLVGGPLGLLASRAYMNANPVSEGQARAISWGGVWGTWQGFGWAEVLDIGEEEICTPDFGCYPSGDNGEELVASMVVGGLTGIVGGALLARDPIRSGVSSGAQGGSTWGSIYGAMLAGIVDDDAEDGVLVTSLLAGNVGLVAGAALASKHGLSRSDIRMINLGALIGGLGGLGLDLLIQPDDTEVALAIPLATSLVGLGIAASRTGGAGGDVDGATPDLDRALIDYRDGRLSLGPPLPRPSLLALDRPDAPTEWSPGLTVQLLRATF